MTDTSSTRNKLAERAQQAPARTDGNGNGGRLTIQGLIDRQLPEIRRALPKHMDPDRLARIATTTIKTTPQLLECSAESLLGALMLSAQTGLEPGPLGHVYFVPRKIKGRAECQWMLGYKGIIELARRSGQLVSIEAREVCDRDEFEYQYGLDEQLVHRPAMDGDRGPIVAFWGLAKFKDGGHYFLVMSRADVDKAMARSDSAKSDFSPWKTDYAAMGRKTVIRRMAPYLPLSPEQANVMANDEAVRTDLRADMADVVPAATWIDAEVVAEQPAELDPPSSPAEAPDKDETAPEASPAPAGPRPSQAQMRKLHASMRDKGITGDERHSFAAGQLGRPVDSLNDLTVDDVSRLIDLLDNGVPVDADPDTGDGF